MRLYPTPRRFGVPTLSYAELIASLPLKKRLEVACDHTAERERETCPTIPALKANCTPLQAIILLSL